MFFLISNLTLFNLQTVINIFMNISTTGKHVDSDIVRLAAISENPDEPSFDAFIQPNYEISGESTKYHGIFFDNDERKFYQTRGEREVRLQMKNPKDAFQDFFDWIENVKENDENHIRLVSHNAHSFHLYVLVIITFFLILKFYYWFNFFKNIHFIVK